jgi:valyl-tRNA synthetase
MLTNKPPFKELLLNGNVLAPDGKKMSKSLGNIIAPDALIAQYSADAVRQWAALSGALAKDRPFSYKDIAFARSFQNKLWNAAKFVENALKDYDAAAHDLRVPDKWILSRLNRVIAQCDEHYKNFDFHAALSALHEFFWHEFCDYYLEEVKHRLYSGSGASKRAAQFSLRSVLLAAIKLLAPIAPHITEEIYQGVYAADAGSIHVSKWPVADASYVDEGAEEAGRLLNAVLSEIRKHKAGNKLALSAPLARIEISAGRYAEQLKSVEEEIRATGRVAEITYGSAQGGQALEAFPEVRLLVAV